MYKLIQILYILFIEGLNSCTTSTQVLYAIHGLKTATVPRKINFYIHNERGQMFYRLFIMLLCSQSNIQKGLYPCEKKENYILGVMKTRISTKKNQK